MIFLNCREFFIRLFLCDYWAQKKSIHIPLYVHFKSIIVDPVITEKLSNENARRCDLPRFSAKYICFNLINIHLIMGLKLHILYF